MKSTTSLHKSFITLLVAAQQVYGGAIACQSTLIAGPNSGEGVPAQIPAHKWIFNLDDNRGECFAELLADDCQELVGRRSENSNFSCDNGRGNGDFWITNDGCFNVEADGVHHYCCGAGISTAGTTMCTL